MSLANRLVAHRGWPQHYPENSLVGLEAAILAGARWVEFDLQMTRDQVPVLLHDTDLGRVADRRVVVFEHQFDELNEIEAGEPDRWGDRFSATRLASLKEAVELLECHPQVRPLVEIKTESIDLFGIDAALDAILPVLSAIRERSTVISYNADLLTEARRRTGLPIGYIVDRYGRTAHAVCDALKPEFAICNRRKLPRDRSWWQGEHSWVVYAVNQLELATSLIDRGADLIETDRIGELIGADWP